LKTWLADKGLNKTKYNIQNFQADKSG